MFRRPPRPWAAAAGVLVDEMVGEPPDGLHPVRWFGSTMQGVEGRLYRDDTTAGVVHAAVGLAIGLGAGTVVRSTAVATSLAVAGRSLAEVATSIGDALVSSDLDRARERLPALVSRAVDGLDAQEMARAVVESVAENTVDAVVAPALWAACGGSPGVLCYRAVNTLDAMVGYRDARYRRFGWASARLDDLANYLPARVTALLVVAVRPAAGAAVWRAVRTQAPAHPSPNAGVAEAAFAAALGLRLGGANRYGAETEVRTALGAGRAAEPGDVARAVRLSRHVRAALVVALGLAGAGAAALRCRRERDGAPVGVGAPAAGGPP